METVPDTGNSITLQIGFIIALTIINAFFAATEIALVSSSKAKMKVLAQNGDKRAVRVLKVMEEPTKILSTIQVAITFAGFLASAFAAVGIADNLTSFITPFEIPYPNEIAIVIITIVLSYFTLVFGELFPKRIAFQHSEGISMAVIGFVSAVSKIFAPLNFILSKSVNLLLFITRQKEKEQNDEYSEEEVKSMIEASHDAGALNEEEKKMLNSIFEFDDTSAYEIMTPRTDVFSIDINDPPEEYLNELMNLKFTRIPVYDDDADNIIGILNVKDFIIKAKEYGFENVDLNKILRKPMLVPDNKKVDSLLHELQKTKQQIAILIDEYGGFAGIVTMEDIIEEIVGEIDDEYDDEETGVVKLSGNIYTFEGNVDLDDFNEETGLNLESENSETIGGFIIDILEEIPHENNKDKWEVVHNNLIFKIESVKDRRIEKGILRILSPEQYEKEIDKEKVKEREKDKEKKRKKGNKLEDE